MKTDVSETRAPTIWYPLLAKAKSSDYIVLFTASTEGVVLYGSEVYKVGHFSADWISCWDTSLWQILPEGTTITLTQDFSDEQK